MRRRPPAIHRTIVVVDLEKFGDPARSNADRLTLRAGMYKAVRSSLVASGIRWKDCATTDCGDGVLVLVPAHVPKVWLVTRLTRKLTDALRGHNGECESMTRLRLRVAVHAGEVTQDSYGVCGSAINYAFRLIDSPDLKSTLSASSQDIAFIVSEWFYDEVVRQDPHAAPATFRRVRVANKEVRTNAWMRLASHRPALQQTTDMCQSSLVSPFDDASWDSVWN